MDELRFKVGIVCMIVMLAFCWFFMSMQQKAIESAIEDSREDRLQVNPEKFNAALKKNEVLWNAAFKSLKDRKFDESASSYYQASSFEFEIANVTHEVKPGLKAQDWLAQQKKEFEKAAIDEFENVAGSSVSNPLNSGLFGEFHSSFRNYIPQVEKIFQSRKSEVIGARIRAAGKWFRIAPDSDEKEYLQPIETALKNQWNPVYGKTLIGGPLLDEREIKSTWMVLELKADLTGASYVLKKKGMITPLSVKVPETVVISFNLRKLVPIPTSWDKLPAVSVHIPAPSSIMAPGFDVTSEIEKVAAEHRKKLIEMIAGKVPVIPRFELYPGKDLSKISLIADNQIDPESARILGCIEPARLVKEASSIAAGGNKSHQSQLIGIAIEQDIDSLGSWLTEILDKADDEMRGKVLQLLKNKPAFGGFSPILKLLEKASTDDARTRILLGLRGWLFEEKIRQAFVLSISKSGNPGRNELCRAFLSELPLDQLGNYRGWLTDPDKDFGKAAYQIISSRDPDSHSQLMVSSMENSDDETKMRMVSDFHFNSRKHGKDVIELFKRIAMKSTLQPLRTKSLEILMYEMSSTADGWKALEEASKANWDAGTASRIRQALATNIASANPAAASEYQMSALLGTDREQRKAAAHKFFRSRDDVDQKMKSIVPHISRYSSEPGFFEALLRGLSEQGMSNLKDPGIPELEQMMNMAIDHPEAMVRYFGYSISHRAWGKGQKKFAGIIRRGLESESNQWARGQGENLLKSIDAAENNKSD